jgi:hypothetical protein
MFLGTKGGLRVFTPKRNFAPGGQLHPWGLNFAPHGVKLKKLASTTIFMTSKSGEPLWLSGKVME